MVRTSVWGLDKLDQPCELVRWTAEITLPKGGWFALNHTPGRGKTTTFFISSTGAKNACLIWLERQV